MKRRFPAPSALIDHRGAMAFIDELLDCDATAARCRAVIRADNPFLVGERLPGWVLLEYIAQSVAVFAGYRRRADGEAHRHGLLLGCRSMQLPGPDPRVKDVVDLRVEEVVRLDGFGNFRGAATCDGVLLAEGVLSVLETEQWPVTGGQA